jgi:hypothetical protein
MQAGQIGGGDLLKRPRIMPAGRTREELDHTGNQRGGAASHHSPVHVDGRWTGLSRHPFGPRIKPTAVTFAIRTRDLEMGNFFSIAIALRAWQFWTTAGAAMLLILRNFPAAPGPRTLLMRSSGVRTWRGRDRPEARRHRAHGPLAPWFRFRVF